MTATALFSGNRGGGTWLEEPMSPLLKRRLAAKGGVSADFIEGRRKKKDGTGAKDKSSSGTLALAANLQVSATKIVQMGDCPQTPKRVPSTPKTARLRQEIEWSTATIMESNDDEDD